MQLPEPRGAAAAAVVASTTRASLGTLNSTSSSRDGLQYPVATVDLNSVGPAVAAA